MPPELDDKREGLDTSEQANDVTDAEGAAAKADAPDAGAAGSSPAGDDEPKDLSSVVRDVVAKTEEAAPPAAKKEGAEDADEPDGAAPDAKADDPDYKDVPFHKHPRFQELLRKSKTHEVDATRYRAVETFLQENHLSSDEAADGLRVMALAKTDPAKALAELKPFVQKLLIAAGEILPDDLRSRVQQGDLTAAAAHEISVSRAQLAQREQAVELDRQRQAQEQSASLAASLRDTANAWAQDRDLKDPAFKAKYPLLEREVAYLQRTEGVPRTVEGVRDQLNRAYTAVNVQARAVAPAPAPRPEKRPIVGGAAPGNHAPAPKTMVEAIRAARAQ